LAASTRSSYTLWDVTNTTSLPTTATNVFVSADGEWQWVEAANRLYGVTATSVANGNAEIFRLSLASTILQVRAIGIPAPTSAVTFNSTASGSLSGTYDVVYTWYDSVRGIESGRSPVYSTTVASVSLTVNQVDTPPTGVDFWRVYLRKTGLNTVYRRDTSLELSTGVGTATLSFSDASINNFLLEAPGVNDNQPLPDQARALAYHLSRMFVTDGRQVYFSEVGNPDAYNTTDNYISVNEGDGRVITGLLSIDETNLAIFKEDALFVLQGDSPQNWIVNRVPGTLGGWSPVLGDGMVAFYSAEGPAIWSGSASQAPEILVWETLKPLVDQGEITDFTGERVGFDPDGHRFLFTLTTTSGRWTVAPWSTQHKAWEATAWDLPYPRAMAVGLHPATEAPALYLGTTLGTVGYLDRAVKTDVADNTTGANLVHDLFVEDGYGATSASLILYDPTTAITLPLRDRVSGSYTGSSAYVIDGLTLQVEKCDDFYVTTFFSTGKRINLDSPLSFTPSAGSKIVFDCPVVEFDTTEYGGETHTRKRGMLAHMLASSNGDTPFLVGVYVDGAESPSRVFTATIRGNRPEEYADAPDALTGATYQFKQRVGVVGNTLRLRVVGYEPSTRWGLTRIGVKVGRWSR
jgi:hypothetical protein